MRRTTETRRARVSEIFDELDRLILQIRDDLAEARPQGEEAIKDDRTDDAGA